MSEQRNNKIELTTVGMRKLVQKGRGDLVPGRSLVCIGIPWFQQWPYPTRIYTESHLAVAIFVSALCEAV